MRPVSPFSRRRKNSTPGEVEPPAWRGRSLNLYMCGHSRSMGYPTPHSWADQSRTPSSSPREAERSWSLCLLPLLRAGPQKGGALALTATGRRGFRFLAPSRCPGACFMGRSGARSARMGGWGGMGKDMGSWRGSTPLPLSRQPSLRGAAAPRCLGLLSSAVSDQHRGQRRGRRAGPAPKRQTQPAV